jgi:hypothetical protein
MLSMGILILLGLWLAVSLLGNLSSFERLRRWDFFSLIPQWKFFSPNPATRDFVFLYRLQLTNESLTNWIEVPLDSSRAWWNFIWNPGKRQRKAFFDLASELSVVIKDGEMEVAQLSIPYLALLNFISGRYPYCRGVQFLLMLTSRENGSDTPSHFFHSCLHPIGDPLATE